MNARKHSQLPRVAVETDDAEPAKLSKDDPVPPMDMKVVLAFAVAFVAVLVVPFVMHGLPSLGLLNHEPVYTSSILKRLVETRKNQLFLLVLGRIYDVSKGKQYYGEGGEYSGYCQGKDNTRAFLTADFEKDASDDLSGMGPAQCLGIQHWVDFYVDKDSSQTYPYVGLHEGRMPPASESSSRACTLYRLPSRSGTPLARRVLYAQRRANPGASRLSGVRCAWRGV